MVLVVIKKLTWIIVFGVSVLKPIHAVAVRVCSAIATSSPVIDVIVKVIIIVVVIVIVIVVVIGADEIGILTVVVDNGTTICWLITDWRTRRISSMAIAILILPQSPWAPCINSESGEEEDDPPHRCCLHDEYVLEFPRSQEQQADFQEHN